MALFSDLLPYILQQQQTALPGGPNLGPAIPRSPTNVTAMNMPSAKLPGAFDFANTANNFANTMGENVLRQQQAHLSDLQAQHIGYQISLIPEFRKALDEFMKRGSQPNSGGAGGSEQGGGLYQGSGTSGKLSPTDGGTDASGKTVSLAMQEPPEVQEAVAKKLALESGIQHWSGIDPNTGLPWNQKLHAALTAAGLPTSGKLTEEQWTQANPLIKQYESEGGKNIPNYKFGPGYTAGGTHQITNSTWNMIGGPQIAAAMKGAGAQSASAAPPVSGQSITVPPPADTATPVTPQGGLPTRSMGEPDDAPDLPVRPWPMDLPDKSGAPPPGAEDNDASLAPGEAGDVLTAQAKARENLSPREQLNRAMLAQLGGGQVAGDNAAPSGGMSGGALPGIIAGQMPTPTLPGRDPSLSMLFNPAAQAAAGPSPAVPSAPAGGPPTSAPAPTSTAAAGMAQALAAAKAALPQGQQGGFQLDPTQAQMLKLGMLGQLSGMGNLTAPLERAFENSPWWAQQKAAAAATGAASGKIPYILPEKLLGAAGAYADPANNAALQRDLSTQRAEGTKGVELKYTAPIAGAKAAAPTQALFDAAMAAPEGSPLRNAYMAELLKQGGIKQFFGGERPGSPVWRINPQTFQPEMVATSPVPGHQVDAEGNKYAGFTTPPLPSTSLNPQGAPPKFQPVAMSEIGPGVTENLKTQAAEEQKVRQGNIDAGGAAQQQQAALMTMKADVPNFYTGPWADKVQAAQSFMRLLPGGDRFVDQVASRESFDKNTGYLVREAVRATSPRAAVQEFKLIGGSLPNADMSPVGLNRVINELMGLNDYKVAKAQAQGLWEGRQGARTPTGDVTGFETDWQGKVSPYAFIVGRMDQADRQKLFSQVGQTKEGQSEIQHLMEQVKYIQDSGLHQFLR